MIIRSVTKAQGKGMAKGTGKGAGLGARPMWRPQQQQGLGAGPRSAGHGRWAQGAGA